MLTRCRVLAVSVGGLSVTVPPFVLAAPDTAGGAQLHPEALSGEAEVPGGPRGLPPALGPHQQPAEEDPP